VTTVGAQRLRIRANNFTTRDGLASNVVNTAVQDGQGYIWLGTNHGLTRFDGHRFANFYVEEDGKRRIEGITHIAIDTTRNVLLLSGKGYRLLCFDLRLMRFVDAEGMNFSDGFEQENNNEQAYVARARTLNIDRGNRTGRRHDLHYVRLDDGRELFATIDNGFFLYDPKTGQLQHFSSSDKNPVIESDYLNGVLKDRSGCVWLATTFAGIYRLELDEGELVPHGALGPNIRSLAQLNSREMAVSDMAGNLFRYDLETRQCTLLSRQAHRVYAICKDPKGRLWTGTRGGGVQVDGQSVEVPAHQIYDIVFDRHGTAWIATLDAGLIEVREKSDGTRAVATHLEGEGVHELDIDPEGRLWIATDNGVFVKDGEQMRKVYEGCKVVCICHSADGTVWAGSNGNGLLRISGDKVDSLQSDNGLSNNCVESVVCDDEGHVVAGTDQGISIVGIADGTVRNIYSPYGLMADTYNENAIVKLSDGRIFMGSLKGMVELSGGLHSQSAVYQQVAPCITSVDVNDVPRYDGLQGVVHLAHNQNNLCFCYSSFAYRDLSSVVYSFWLEGVDGGWRPSTKESQALYTNLSPGCYRFHVRSSLMGAGWGEETVLEVLIAQPWYWTWWARSFYLLLVVLFLWYEWHQYQQRLSLRRQFDQRLAALYAVEAQREQLPSVAGLAEDVCPALPWAAGHEATAEMPGGAKPVDVAPSRKGRAFLDKLDHFILENLLQTDFDVNMIAQEMCMSYSTLHRRVKMLTGMTANEYVRKHRLAKAMQLLHDGNNVTEVSLQCGFSSPSYFTRCFKAEYGVLPSEVGV